MANIKVRQKYEWLWDGVEYFKSKLDSHYVIESMHNDCPEPTVLGEVWRCLNGTWQCDHPELQGLYWSQRQGVIKAVVNLSGQSM